MLSACNHLAAPPSGVQSWPARRMTLNQIQNWQITGKIAVITAEDSGSASVDWIQHQQQFSISLFGPLGLNGLKLNGSSRYATLTTANGQHYSAHSPELLLKQQWGWNLPVSYLNYWVRGLPVPNLPTENKWDANHRLERLQQAGFDIQFLSYVPVSLSSEQTIELPNKISITSPTFKTKMIIYDWKL